MLRCCTCTCHINHCSVRRPHDDNHILPVTCAVANRYLLLLPLLFPISKEIKINPFYSLVFVRTRLSILSALMFKRTDSHSPFLYRQKCAYFFHRVFTATSREESARGGYMTAPNQFVRIPCGLPYVVTSVDGVLSWPQYETRVGHGREI